jgi:hypothetical protein
MEKLKFKKDIKPTSLSEDFYYMIDKGGWCNIEKYLESDDAKKVRKAINIIKQYEEQGIDDGYFDEI